MRNALAGNDGFDGGSQGLILALHNAALVEHHQAGLVRAQLAQLRHIVSVLANFVRLRMP